MAESAESLIFDRKGFEAARRRAAIPLFGGENGKMIRVGSAQKIAQSKSETCEGLVGQVASDH